MPTCLVYSARLSLLLSARHQGRDVVASNTPCKLDRIRCTRTRWAAFSAVATAVKREVGSATDSHHHTFTVLHKTRSLLPRILPSEVHAPHITDSLEFWHELLTRAYDDLSLSPTAQQEDRLRIAVYACDGLSGAHELVTALLEDPFASDSQKEALRTRWHASQDEKNSLSLQYGSLAMKESDNLFLQSSWLRSFSVPLRVQELRAPPSHPHTTRAHEVLKDIFNADIPIIVCNPISTPLRSLLSSTRSPLPLSHRNAILVITSTQPSPEAAERIKSLLPHDIPTLFIDPSRALGALRTLSSSPSSPTAVQSYQDNFAGSRISSLTEAVSNTLAAESQDVPPSAVISALHRRTAQSLIQDALDACRSALTRAEREVDKVCAENSSMRDRAEELKVRVAREVFGMANEGADEGDEIQKAVKKSSREIRAVMDRLTWWRLLWKVDDVGDIIATAVDRAWCKDLERKLIFHAGRLAIHQQSFTDSSKALLASFSPPSPFYSHVLQNAVSQLSSAPSFPMNVTALTLPLHSRRRQLGYPTGRLQTTANRAVLGMGGSVFGGFGIAWAGWAGQLGLLDIGMQMETALGLGLLGAVAGVRVAVGSFERAKKHWWQDYDRVGEGLERDLRETLDRTIEEQVIVISEKTCSGLEQLVVKRKDEIEELKDEVAILDREVEHAVSY